MSSISQRSQQWKRLAQFTQARVGLNRVGVSQTTHDVLDFLEAHAHARDAIHAVLNAEALIDEFQRAGFQVVHVHSRAESRLDFLQHPDLGRRLDQSSAQRLAESFSTISHSSIQSPDQVTRGARRLAIVVGDGLSPLASMCNALPVVIALRTLLHDWELGPVIVAEQARVALADEVGVLCSAAVTLMLLGERPGLQAADSLGAYITYHPHIGRSDAERNCVSNIHPRGLNSEAAAVQIAWFSREALRFGATGIALKSKQISLPDHSVGQ